MSDSDIRQTLLIRLETIQRIIGGWVKWNKEERTKEGLETPGDTHIMHVPHWPTHKQLQNWCDIVGQAIVELLPGTFQKRVNDWIHPCLGSQMADDEVERDDRFLEEALELTQTGTMTRERAHWLVDYVFNRDVGQPSQEVGGVMVTLAALCNTRSIDLMKAAETELDRINSPEVMEKVRLKQLAKPKPE